MKKDAKEKRHERKKTWKKKDAKEKRRERKKDAKEKRRERKKDAKEKRQPEPIHSFIIMAYWINVGSRGRQSLCRPKKVHNKFSSKPFPKSVLSSIYKNP